MAPMSMNFRPQNCGAVLRTSAHDQERRGLLQFSNGFRVLSSWSITPRRPRWWAQIGAVATRLLRRYDIVTQQHGGAIAVNSEAGAFTEFTIRLPRRHHTTATGKAS